MLFISSNPWDACGAKAFGLNVAWIERVTPEAMALACLESETLPPLTMFKVLRTQMDELGVAPDHRIHGLAELAHTGVCQKVLNMSLESVRAFFAEKAPDISVIESQMSSATVALAAEAYGVEPARIAKTLSLRIGDRVVLIVAAGTSRMDNKKVKALFGGKPKMLGLEEVAEITGHEVGGVCPFGLKTPLPVYCDVSLKAFDIVVPAAGSTHSAVKITPARMAELDRRRMGRRLRTQARTGSAGLFVFLIERSRLRPQRLRLHLLRRARPRGAVCCGTRCAGAADWPAAVRRFDSEYRAAIAGELRRVLPQAGHDPVDIRNLITAKPPYVGRAGHLLFPGSAIFLR